MVQALRTSNTLCGFLKNCVRTIKGTYPNLSSIQIAKKLGIPTSTLGRIENQDVQSPSFSYAMRIVRAACKNDEIMKFISKFYPEMEQIIKTVYSGNQNAQFVSAEIEEFFEDPNMYELTMFITSYDEILEKEIINRFGQKGQHQIQNLIENEIVRREGDKIVLCHSKVNASQKTVHKLLQHLIQHNYDVNAFGEKDNWLTVQYDSVDKNYVMPKMKKILERANQELRELINSSKSKGKDVVWVGLSMDCLDKTDLTDKEKQRVIQ